MSIEFRSDQISTGRRDRLVRRRLSLWDAEPPKHPRLMELYRYWESLRPEGLIPARTEFDILKLRAVMGTTCVIDVDCPDPQDYLVRLYGTSLTLPNDMSNRTLKNMDFSDEYREMLAEDYFSAREIGVPLYHEVAALINYSMHTYARLILPFAGDHRNVNQLIVCSVHQDFPDLVKLLD